MKTKTIKVIEPNYKKTIIVEGDSRKSWMNNWFDWDKEELK
jgi:hypothetical protein